MIDNNTIIQPGDVYEVAVKTLPPEDIDHHYSDLYIRVTPASTAIINQIENKPIYQHGMETRYKHPALLSTFKSQINGCMWYDLPFCCTPYFTEVEN